VAVELTFFQFTRFVFVFLCWGLDSYCRHHASLGSGWFTIRLLSCSWFVSTKPHEPSLQSQLLVTWKLTTWRSNHRPDHASHDAHKRASESGNTVYDYVVVGSGPGGGPVAARLAIAGYKVLLIDAGDDQGNATKQIVPALQIQSTEYEPMRWDYFVNHYSNLTRQEEDSKMTYRTPAGDYHVGANPPPGSEPLGILYPRSGTLGGCAAHNAMM